MRPVLVQILVAFFVSAIGFMLGFAVAWPSYALKILESDQSPLGYKITQSDGNVIGSIVMLGSSTSVTIGGYINEKIGRKRSQILSGLCITLAWSIIATAKSVTHLVIGRYLSGLGGGLFVVVVLVFLAEISQSSVKGTVIAISNFMFNIGTLASYILGWYCSYEVINYLTLSLLVTYIVLATLFLKETPQYLLSHGKEKEALNSLKFYRGVTTTTQEVLDELADMRNQMKTGDKNYSTNLKNISKYETENLKQEKVDVPEQNILQETSWKIVRSSKSVQRALVILVTHMILTVFMGMIVVQAYSGRFFVRAVPDLSPDLCSVILAIMVSLTSIIAIVITDKIPRRVLMLSTCFLSGTCVALVGSMLRWSWTPDLCIPITMIFFSIFFCLGTVNLPMIQLAESFPPQVKSLASTIISTSMCLSNFIVLYLFEPAVNFFGLDGTFFLFAIIGFGTTAVAYFFMRETRNVPFEIVQEMYRNGYLYSTRSLNNKNVGIIR